MSVRVVYRDVDFEAKNQLTDVKINGDRNEVLMDDDLFYYCAVPPVHDATMEENYWRLDGSFDVVDELKNPNAAFCSSTLSNGANEYGYNIENSPEITYVFENGYPIRNITFSFDEEAFCTSVLIEGYGDIEQTNLLFTANAYPDDAFYNFSLDTEYNVYVLKFTFKTMNKPNRFFRLYGIDSGTAYRFSENEVYDVSILTETSLINQQLFMGTSDLTVDTKKYPYINFIKYKPYYIYKNDVIQQTHFLSNFDEVSTNKTSLEGADSIYVMSEFNDAFPIEQTSGVTYEETARLINGAYYCSNVASKYGKQESWVFEKWKGSKPEHINFDKISEFSGPYEWNIPLKQLLIKYKKYSKSKIYVLDNVTVHLDKADYTNKSLKYIFENLSFASQYRISVQNNGFICIGNKETLLKNVLPSRIFMNQKKIIEEKVTDVEYSKHYYTVRTYQNYYEYDAGVGKDTATHTNYEKSDIPIWFLGGEVRPPKSNIPVSHTVSCGIDENGNYNFVHKVNVGYRYFNYYVTWAFVEHTTTKKTYNLSQTDSNDRTVKVSVSDNPFITSQNETVFLKSLADYYKHNISIEFDMIIEDEVVGDYVEVQMPDKIYRGYIEKLEYTMQGKKIGTVKMRIYDEENVNG